MTVLELLKLIGDTHWLIVLGIYLGIEIVFVVLGAIIVVLKTLLVDRRFK